MFNLYAYVRMVWMHVEVQLARGTEKPRLPSCPGSVDFAHCTLRYEEQSPLHRFCLPFLLPVSNQTNAQRAEVRRTELSQLSRHPLPSSCRHPLERQESLWLCTSSQSRDTTSCRVSQILLWWIANAHLLLSRAELLPPIPSALSSPSSRSGAAIAATAKTI